MSGPDASALGRLHLFLEHYTPDGTPGRLLLGAPLLILAPVLLVAGFNLLVGALSFLTFLAGVAFLLAFPPSLVLGVVCLWPVYLSLIGNVESPEAYPGTSRRVRAAGREDPESAEATLKRRYAEGDISRREFEDRLDALLAAEEGGPDRGRSGIADDRERETESAR